MEAGLIPKMFFWIIQIKMNNILEKTSYIHSYFSSSFTAESLLNSCSFDWNRGFCDHWICLNFAFKSNFELTSSFAFSNERYASVSFR